MKTYMPLWSAPYHGLSATLASVRVATTCSVDTAAAIAAAVQDLVSRFHERNEIGRERVKLVLFTATSDLRSAKPAAAARAAGWNNAQFLCLAEMPTSDDLPRCIRALVYVECTQYTSPLKPVYLNGAQSLRPDLVDD